MRKLTWLLLILRLWHEVANVVTVTLECLHGQLAEQLELPVESFVAIKVKLHLLNGKILL